MDWFLCARKLRHERLNQLNGLEQVSGVIRALQTSMMGSFNKNINVNLKMLTILAKRLILDA